MDLDRDATMYVRMYIRRQDQEKQGQWDYRMCFRHSIEQFSTLLSVSNLLCYMCINIFQIM